VVDSDWAPSGGSRSEWWTVTGSSSESMVEGDHACRPKPSLALLVLFCGWLEGGSRSERWTVTGSSSESMVEGDHACRPKPSLALLALFCDWLEGGSRSGWWTVTGRRPAGAGVSGGQ
jgi:hypothetical protein